MGRIERNGEATLTSLQSIAEALRVDVDDLIVDELQSERNAVVREWTLNRSSALSDWRFLPNGMAVRLFRMQSSTVPGRLARGKQYRLSGLSKDVRQSVSAYLARQTATCERIQSPYIARAILCEPDADPEFWWVIDEWIEGENLAVLIESGNGIALAKRIAADLLEGLEALHTSDIIRRGLTPETIIVRKNNGRALLTDFEIAKFMDESPTVRPRRGFLDSPFIAPEVRLSGREIGPQADFYSWAVIVGTLLTRQPATDLDKVRADLAMCNLPKSVLAVLLQSLSVRWRERPDSTVAMKRSVLKWAQQA